MDKNFCAAFFGLFVVGGLVFTALTPAWSALGQGASNTVVTLPDLGKEAARAQPALAALFRDLSRPADKVTLNDGTHLWVVPLGKFIGQNPGFDGFLELRVLEGKEGEKARKVSASELDRVLPFEEIGLKKIADFLGKKPADAPGVSELFRLQAAEKALQALLWFHQGARLRPVSGTSPWDSLRTALEDSLQRVRRDQLEFLTRGAEKNGDWTEALKLADRLLPIYPQETSLGSLVRKAWSRYALLQLASGEEKAAQDLWQRMERQFLNFPEAEPLQKALEKRAAELYQEAKNLPDSQARAQLTRALALWPRLPGLRNDLLQRQKKYRILYVGVRQLPEFLSPATAWTDAEKQTIDLLFEALVLSPDAGKNDQHYLPQLAAALPSPAALNRSFSLRRDAFWADGERVTPGDVRHTLQLLRGPQLPGRISAWLDLFEVPRVETASFGIDFPLRQGLRDPLALFSFKILPQNPRGKPLLRADDPDFARSPVGSGPYVYRGRSLQEGRLFSIFTANPQFLRQPNLEQPHIRELRFFAWKDPANDLAFPAARSALLLDVPTPQLPALGKMGFPPIQTLPNRRVYFLAVNHRLPVLGHTGLRRALGHALDREKILSRRFRGGRPEFHLLETLGTATVLPVFSLREGNPEWHRASNGPFPADSWANCPPPRVPQNLFDSGLARSLFRLAQKDLGKIKLTLKHPDDPQVRQACQEISKQVRQIAAGSGMDIHFHLLGMSERALKEALDRRDYELAYYHLDNVDEGNRLWPVFDPQADALAAGGSNFLGYENDSNLQSLFRAALSRRDFFSVRELTHQIHAHLVQNMPLIPLWQLHSHLALPPDLNPVLSNPLRVFSQVAEWKIADQ